VAADRSRRDRDHRRHADEMKRTLESQHWTRWYSSARWQRMRKQQLAAEPLCRLCKLDDKIEPATVADHVERHFGDPEKFWRGKLQSVCRNCHEVRKKFVEARGYDREVDPETGWPKDARHPANLPRHAFRNFGFGIPNNLRPSAVPVTLVCGPPTWVKRHKKFGDTIISLDEIKLRVGGKMWDTDRQVLRRAIAYRDSMLRSLALQERGRAIVVVGAPTQGERNAWCKALGTSDVVVLDTAADECIRRLHADPARAHAVADLTNGVKRWHYLHNSGPSPRIVQESPVAQALLAS
jgi:5-methylcytosine-specific restriction protein A